VQSAIGNHTPICIVSPAPTVPQVRDGKLSALAVTRKVRSQALPNIPTMAESGYPDIEGENWFGFIVPAGTPKEIVALLHLEIVKLGTLPDVEKLNAPGFDPVATRPTNSRPKSSASYRNGQACPRREHQGGVTRTGWCPLRGKCHAAVGFNPNEQNTNAAPTLAPESRAD
jgi:hypothetical protein